MNDSNTELPTPVSAANHVSLAGDNPGDNPAPVRILVVGNPPTNWVTVLAQAIMDWYATVDQVPIRLVVTNDAAGRLAAEMISNHEIHHQQEGRHPLRKLQRVMTADHFSHAVVFRYGPDEYASQWIEFLRSLHNQQQEENMPSFTTTLIQVDLIS